MCIKIYLINLKSPAHENLQGIKYKELITDHDGIHIHDCTTYKNLNTKLITDHDGIHIRDYTAMTANGSQRRASIRVILSLLEY